MSLHMVGKTDLVTVSEGTEEAKLNFRGLLSGDLYSFKIGCGHIRDILKFSLERNEE